MFLQKQTLHGFLKEGREGVVDLEKGGSTL